MFTGIIQTVGRVETTTATASGRRLAISLAGLGGRALRTGDSVAVNGACLTAVALEPGMFVADVSAETLRLTTLGSLVVGMSVNLEPAMTLAEPLGGHLLTGHIDGVAEVAEWRSDGGTVVADFRLPAGLRRYAARKGSIAIDGTSLTVNEVAGERVRVTLIPHTLAHTIMCNYQVGTRVNVEVDLIARYVERLLSESGASQA